VDAKLMRENSFKDGETRKLQITGGSTYVISLPKRWVTQTGLEKGSPLIVRQEQDGSLAIVPPELGKLEKEEEEAQIKISPEDSSEAVIRKTVSVYLLGYNIIHIRAKDQQKEISSTQRNAVKTFARNMLVGTEIVTDTSKELTLQVLLSYPELSVPSALRRMSIITAS
jgi:phosphate uptake regulator